ncbi:MAG: 1-(5-phosphoribosyl)-5-amino-4-imidazole-carboxylate carboxylase [Lachnospiraceae bacterium]|jgi:NCAIR mutase (PurE)-related protein|nr:1-(5-phosphoribosyl)-5-amino-4-imidazole-carboxylate carboxylase [Lachnospiraceae bacterium]
MDIHKLLEQVKNDEIDITQAEKLLKNLPYEDLGFAKLDHHRSLRSGFGEVVFCQGKSMEHLMKIYQSFYERDTNVLGTRASVEQYNMVKEILPMVKYDPISRVLSIQKKEVPQQGCIAVCTGGTSDIPVAEEAAQTAEFFGSKVIRIYDVGVAGIHRLLSKLDEIRQANCVIAVAGMEGALGGVVAGLIDKPVIAVPTSVGYGANLNGIAALLTMLNSCAEGLAVVNIDNGFGAGYMATQINRLAGRSDS